MYAGIASLRDPPPGDPIANLDGDALRRSLLRAVRSTFPDLPLLTTRVDQRGGDHLILIADEAYAFRFPRAGKTGLDFEIRVLARLRDDAVLPVPFYRHVDPAGRFAGYPLIEGTPLGPSRFRRLPAADRRSLLAEVASVLDTLHGLDPLTIDPLEAWPRMWTAAQFADRLARDRLALLTARFPALTAPLHRFVDRYARDGAPGDIVVHGDLVAEHILIDDTGRLAGIIDFGDVALGDPAHDFLGFWAFGTDAAIEAVRRYGRGSADTGLLDRSRNHFVRYRIDRLYEALRDGVDPDGIGTLAATVEALLTD